MEKIEFQLKGKYINEDAEVVTAIREILVRKDCKCAIIQSPQGTGKNEFLNSFDFNYSLIEPTRMLTEQQHKKYGGLKLIGFEDEYLGYDTSIKSTFASAIKAEASNNSILVVDEAHKILDYAGFAYDTAIATIEVIISFTSGKKKVILLTATPEPIIELFENMKGRLPEINYWIQIKARQLSPYLSKLVVIPHSVIFKKYILESQLKNNTGKQVGLINTKDNLRFITDGLISKERNAIGISSDNRDNDGIKPFYDVIVNSGRLTHDILNATSFIDCGINLYDDDITDMYCMGYNIASIKQFFCRARNSKPIGHIQIRALNDIELSQIRMGKEALFNELYNYAKISYEYYKKGLLPESTLKQITGIVESRVRGYIGSRLAIRQYMRDLYDRYKLSTFESISEVMEGYYESIELFSPEKNKQELISRAVEYLEKYIGLRLFQDERQTIIDGLNAIGVEGKSFKPMVEKCGYEVTHAPNKEWYKINKRE